MGYKSLLRSVASASNKAAKARAKQARIQEKSQQKVAKTINSIDQNLEKVRDELENQYAKGKISKERYDELKPRLDDITIDVVLFGKQAGVAVAKRYATGQVDRAEFDQIVGEILPPDLLNEKANVKRSFETTLNQLKAFIEKISSSANDGSCQHCGSQPSFFRSVYKEDGFDLCGRCLNVYNATKEYKGHSGFYFTAAPIVLNPLHIANPPIIQISINRSHLN